MGVKDEWTKMRWEESHFPDYSARILEILALPPDWARSRIMGQ